MRSEAHRTSQDRRALQMLSKIGPSGNLFVGEFLKSAGGFCQGIAMFLLGTGNDFARKRTDRENRAPLILIWQSQLPKWERRVFWQLQLPKLIPRKI